VVHAHGRPIPAGRGPNTATCGFNECLRRGKLLPTGRWNCSAVSLLADIHPVAPAVPPGGSLSSWIWLIVVVAVLVVGGLVLASRH